METVKLTQLQKLHVLFPEDIEDLKENYEIMASRLTPEQMLHIRTIFKGVKGIINLIMGMTPDEIVFTRKKIGDMIISIGMERDKFKESLNDHRNGIVKD